MKTDELKPNELRIGNLVFNVGYNPQDGWPIGYKPVEKATVQTIQFPSFYEPIPLTEEWLVKFGFQKKEKYGWKGNGADWQPETSKTEYQDYVIDAGDEDYVFYRVSTWSWRKTEDLEWQEQTDHSIHKGSWYPKAEDSIHISYPLTYVHQLQNLYFFLTGTELEIK